MLGLSRERNLLKEQSELVNIVNQAGLTLGLKSSQSAARRCVLIVSSQKRTYKLPTLHLVVHLCLQGTNFTARSTDYFAAADVIVSAVFVAEGHTYALRLGQLQSNSTRAQIAHTC